MCTAIDPGRIRCWRHRVAAVAVGLLLAASFGGCAIKKPQVPSTDFTLSISVADDRTTIRQIVEEREEFLRFDQETLMNLDFSAEVQQREEVGERLRIGPMADTLRISVEDLVATPIATVIPEQEFSIRQTLDFPDDRIRIARARISRGDLILRVQNGLPVAAAVGLSLEEFKKPDGSARTFIIDPLEPGGVREVAFSLDGDEFAPEDPLRLGLSYEVNTGASEVPATIAPGSEIVVAAGTEGLSFSRVEGVLDGVELPFAPVTEEVEFPKGLDHIALGDVSLLVHLFSAVGFRSRIDLDIQGTNNAGETASIFVSEFFERGNPDDPVPLVIEPESGELADFLNLLPSTVTVVPTVLLGDGAGVELIEPDHWIRIDSVRFRAPPRFQITADTEIRTDPVFRKHQDPEARERIESNLLSAWVVTAVENHMPIEVGVSLLVASWRTIVRDVIVSKRPELGDDGALLKWLLENDIWNLIGAEDRKEIRERLEILMGLERRDLEEADAAAIAAELDARGSEENRALFLALLLSSLENDAEDGKKEQVEYLLGREILEEEWERIIADNVYSRPELRIPPEGGPFLVDPALVGAGGRVSESRYIRREIELDKDQVLIFLRKGGVYTGVLIQLGATDGEVELYADDYVNVQSGTKIVMELNEDLIEE